MLVRFKALKLLLTLPHLGNVVKTTGPHFVGRLLCPGS